MAPYFLHISLRLVVKDDKSLEGELAATAPSSTDNICPHLWKDEEVTKLWSFSFSINEYDFSLSLSCWLWEYYEYIMNICKKGKSFPILYYVRAFTLQNNLLFWTEGKQFMYSFYWLDCRADALYLYSKQLNILLTAVYLAVHYTLQFVVNAYVKQKKMTSRE